MKTKYLTSTLLALALVGAAGNSYAVDTGTLRFEGNILGGTCDLAAGDVNRTIRLPDVRVSDFDSVNRPVFADFNLTAQCDSDVGNVSFIFSGAADGYSFENTGTAGNGVGLRIYSLIGGTESNIRASESQANRTRTVPTAAGNAVLPMRAGYFKNRTVTKGTFASNVTVNITYN